MANENPLNELLKTLHSESENRIKTPSERIMMLSMERDKIFDRIKNTEKELETVEKTDPDNSFALKCVESRRATSESRGYYYTPEQRRRMSEAHKGKTRNDTAMARREAEKSAIRAKLGMNF